MADQLATCDTQQELVGEFTRQFRLGDHFLAALVHAASRSAVVHAAIDFSGGCHLVYFLSPTEKAHGYISGWACKGVDGDLLMEAYRRPTSTSPFIAVRTMAVRFHQETLRESLSVCPSSLVGKLSGSLWR